MFLVRSIFWLAVAYMVIKPGADINGTAAHLSGQAMAAGQQIVAEHVEQIQCGTLQCIGGKAIVSAALTPSPSIGTPMHVLPTSQSVPLPRRRPDWAG